LDKQIILEGIDPLEFFGINNSKIDLITSYFPKIKIAARGNTLNIQGEESELILFEKKFAFILDHYVQFNILTPDIIREILASGISSMEENGLNDTDIIVFGNNGKPVRARTPNQRVLLNESIKKRPSFCHRSCRKPVKPTLQLRLLLGR
jgi:phosphate starvation-inducible protein PhoH and related proteins